MRHFGAQDAEGLHLGIAGGTSSPTGALGDRARTGYNLLGNVSWQPHRRGPFEVRAEAGYGRFGVTNGYLSRLRQANDGDVSMLSGTLNGVWHAPRWGTLRPYLIGGFGAYRRRTQLDEPVIVGVAAYEVYLEARYNDVFTTHKHTNFVLGVRWCRRRASRAPRPRPRDRSGRGRGGPVRPPRTRSVAAGAPSRGRTPPRASRAPARRPRA